MAKGVSAELREFENRLGLPADFYKHLLSEDDWSFVIKLNALVEAACTHALTAHLHAPELAEEFASIDLGNSKHGKVALLRKLMALTVEQASILQLLYQLRNTLAHNVTQVTFSFKHYIKSLDKKQREKFVKLAGHALRETVPVGGKIVSRKDFVLANPKFALWLTIEEVIACLNLEKELAKLKLQKKVFEELVNQTSLSSESPLAPAELNR